MLNPQLFCLPTNSQIYPLVRWTTEYVFSISEAIKIAVSFSIVYRNTWLGNLKLLIIDLIVNINLEKDRAQAIYYNCTKC